MRAERNFQQAQDAVDQMLTRIGAERLANEPRMEKVRSDLLGRALVFYQRFAETEGDTPGIRFKTGLARFRGFAERGGRDLASLQVALRVLVGPSARPRRTIDGEGEMFTGGTADYVGDIKALEDLGVSAVDVRLFATTLDGTIDNMRRFRDEVMAKVR